MGKKSKKLGITVRTFSYKKGTVHRLEKLPEPFQALINQHGLMAQPEEGYPINRKVLSEKDMKALNKALQPKAPEHTDHIILYYKDGCSCNVGHKFTDDKFWKKIEKAREKIS